MFNKKFHPFSPLVFLIFSFSSWGQNMENGIVVRGVGEVEIDNSTASINASVTTVNSEAGTALNQNNNIMNNIMTALLSVGIDSNDINTNQFNIHPKYRWADGSYVFEGYTVTNGVKVKINQISTLGDTIDLLVDAGATKVGSVGFSSADLEAIRAEALQKAITDAKNKAQLLATATGVVLGEAAYINLSSNHTYSSPESHATNALSSAPPISPGTKTITETVSIRYEISN